MNVSSPCMEPDQILDVCPVCDGNGSIPSRHSRRMVDGAGSSFHLCGRCSGSGLVRAATTTDHHHH